MFAAALTAVSHLLSAQTDTLPAFPVREPLTYQKLISCIEGSLSMSDSLERAMSMQVVRNKERKSMGYRLRIYFDNTQEARSISQSIADTFAHYYPDIPVYRIYTAPYFKVTVGDFRTKSDAMRFLEAIRPKYPAVFLVRETFSTI